MLRPLEERKSISGLAKEKEKLPMGSSSEENLPPPGIEPVKKSERDRGEGNREEVMEVRESG